MKRRDLIKRITRAAQAHGLAFEVRREGARHTVYDLDGTGDPDRAAQRDRQPVRGEGVQGMRTEAGQAVVDVTSYHAQVQRGERFWLIYVPELDRWSQARSLTEVDDTARDLIAVMTDTAAEAIELAVSLTLPESVGAHLASAEQLREQASRANSDAAGELRAAARELRATGMTVRDLGRALGVSYQRAHQLVHT